MSLPAFFLRRATRYYTAESRLIVQDIFLQSEAPSYPTGYGVAMGVSVLGITSATIIMLTFRYNNRQRERLSEEDVRDKYPDDQLAELGDRSPLYRYTL